MTLWIDKKYLNLVAHRLERFVWKSDVLANMRCPLCGDSQKNKTKARGYVFIVKGGMLYKCHNCSASMGIGQLVKTLDEPLYREYLLERAKETGAFANTPTPKVHVTLKKPVFKVKINLLTIESLPKEHYARKYIENRKIPVAFLSQLYYAHDFREFIDQSFPNHGKDLKSDSRIVIPFYDANKKLTAVQGRALQADNKIRYITIKADEESDKIYGLERLDVSKKTYVVEGPFDSMFLPNAVAAAGSASFTHVCNYVNNDNTTFIFDNEPRNKDIIKQMNKVIEMGLKICIWPSVSTNFKDINDLILEGYSSQDIVAMIDANTHKNVRAKFMLQSWKKI